MRTKIKVIAVTALILIVVLGPVIYEAFLFYPPMGSDPFDNFLKLFFILLNQRISIETEPPTLAFNEMQYIQETHRIFLISNLLIHRRDAKTLDCVLLSRTAR